MWASASSSPATAAEAADVADRRKSPTATEARRHIQPLDSVGAVEELRAQESVRPRRQICHCHMARIIWFFQTHTAGPFNEEVIAHELNERDVCREADRSVNILAARRRRHCWKFLLFF
jgi:hypothetical protein